MKNLPDSTANLIAKLEAKDFGDDNIGVALVAELLRQTVADIECGRGVHAKKSPLQKSLAIDEANSEALYMVGGLLGYVDHPAVAA